jgi:hypothetical protein
LMATDFRDMPVSRKVEGGGSCYSPQIPYCLGIYAIRLAFCLPGCRESPPRELPGGADEKRTTPEG